jgi:hypothetical protein
MPFEVKNPLAARLLATPEMAVSLKLFMRGPAPIKDLAEAERLPLATAHYRVMRFLEAGLLQKVGERRRKGRPQALYQAVDREFLIPRELIPPQVLARLEGARAWRREFEEGLRRAGEGYASGLLVRLLEDGVLDFAPLREPEPPLLNLWHGGLWLSLEEAKTLQEELLALVEKYKHRRGDRRYLFHLGLVAAPE